VQRKFNGLGQLIQEWQSHLGAVNTGSTPSVQYAYSEMAGGANHSRLTSITYPNGKVLTYNYASGLDDSISRLTSLSDTSGTVESYSYLGLGIVVKRSHPQPTIDLTYIKQSGESNGDAGDQYTGLDRFTRVTDQRWINTTTSTATDRFQYGFDRDSNRLYRDNLVNSAFGELYHANGSGNGYDNLNQLIAFARGTLNGTHDTIISPTHTQSWSLDAAGNFSSQTTDGTQVNRTHNKQNQVTGVGSNTLTLDANGNLTKDDAGQQYVYDAWNRLVAVKNSSGTTITSYKVDALNRRIVENPGTPRDLYYSADWQVLEERLGGVSTATVQYVWSPVYVDALVLRDRSTQNNGTLDERLWVQQDANWNVTALINGSGNVVERYEYDPYGKPTILTTAWQPIGSSAYAWVYLHQEGRFDSTAGLFNFRNRILSPTLGRWLQLDPLLDHAGDSNLFRYVSNAPLSRLDPLGLIEFTEQINDYIPPTKKKWVSLFGTYEAEKGYSSSGVSVKAGSSGPYSWLLTTNQTNDTYAGAGALDTGDLTGAAFLYAQWSGSSRLSLQGDPGIYKVRLLLRITLANKSNQNNVYGFFANSEGDSLLGLSLKGGDPQTVKFVQKEITLSVEVTDKDEQYPLIWFIPSGYVFENSKCEVSALGTILILSYQGKNDVKPVSLYPDPRD
jgi:RHS repeat-associated protein